MFYIMNATGRNHLFTKAMTPLDGANEAWPGEKHTVFVARRYYGNKHSDIHIYGYGTGYKEETVGEICYTQDTGMGYRNRGERLLIQNIIRIDNGEIIDKGNGIGLNEKRRIWVMK